MHVKLNLIKKDFFKDHNLMGIFAITINYLTYLLLGCMILFDLIYYIPVDTIHAFFWFAGNQTIRFIVHVGWILFLLYYLSHRKILPSVIVLVFSLIALIEFLSWIPFNSSEKPSSPGLRVITYNAALSHPEGYLRPIQGFDADVAIITEVNGNWIKYFKSSTIQRRYKYVLSKLNKDIPVYNAIISKADITIVDSLIIPSDFTPPRKVMFAQTIFHGETITIGIAHLEPQLNKMFKRIFSESWKIRRNQSEIVAKFIKGINTPVILAGDFNATPTERCILPIRNVMRDTWLDAGKGFGFTWDSYLSLFRIDYIFVRGFAPARKGRTYNLGSSDHRAYKIDLPLMVTDSNGE